jgi:hypothetical protein
MYLPERFFHGYQGLEIVSVHKDRYNLVLNRLHGTYELYDWTTDYFEQNDLFADRSETPEARELKALLGSFVQQVGLGREAVTGSPAAERLVRSRAEP